MEDLSKKIWLGLLITIFTLIFLYNFSRCLIKCYKQNDHKNIATNKISVKQPTLSYSV